MNRENEIADLTVEPREVSQPTCLWREQDGVIYFSVTSDGTSGLQWLERLEKGGFKIDDYRGCHTRSVLTSEEFRPTAGVKTEIAVLKGVLFEDDHRYFKDICAEGTRRNLTNPNAEAACLIREVITDEALQSMGLVQIGVMHAPIKDCDGDPCILSVIQSGEGRRLGACFLGADLDRWWDSDEGFAFAVTDGAAESKDVQAPLR